jgi:hypothetical protein
MEKLVSEGYEYLILWLTQFCLLDVVLRIKAHQGQRKCNLGCYPDPGAIHLPSHLGRQEGRRGQPSHQPLAIPVSFACLHVFVLLTVIINDDESAIGGLAVYYWAHNLVKVPSTISWRVWRMLLQVTRWETIADFGEVSIKRGLFVGIKAIWSVELNTPIP